MDNKDNNIKPPNGSILINGDLNKLLKTDITKIPIQTYQPQFNIETPKIHIPKKEEAKLKTGIEGWYERNTGKVTIFFATIAILVSIIAIYQAFLLSK